MDLLSATHECDEHSPAFVPIHNPQHGFRFRDFDPVLFAVLFSIPSPLRLIEHYHSFNWWFVGLLQPLADKYVYVLDESGDRACFIPDPRSAPLITRNGG